MGPRVASPIVSRDLDAAAALLYAPPKMYMQLFDTRKLRQMINGSTPPATPPKNAVGSARCDGRVLVTGAAGFIGSHLVEHLVADGYRVRALVRSIPQASFVQQLGAEPVLGGLMDKASLQAACDGTSRVFHLASLVTDWAPWSRFNQNTIEGTRNILAAAVSAGVRRFLHVSTVSVYDDAYTRRNRRVTETAPCHIGDRNYGHYARAKVAAEQEVWACHAQGSLPATVVRPAFVYGPRDRTILPRLVEFLSGRFAMWIGRANPVIDPIYVSDVVRGIAAAAEADRAVGEAYNLAPQREIGMREFLTKLCQHCDIPSPRFSIPYRLASALALSLESSYRVLRRKDPPLITRAGLGLFGLDRHHDPGKAIQHLAWRPEVELDEGLRQTVTWLRNQSRPPNTYVPMPAFLKYQRQSAQARNVIIQ